MHSCSLIIVMPGISCCGSAFIMVSVMQLLRWRIHPFDSEIRNKNKAITQDFTSVDLMVQFKNLKLLPDVISDTTGGIQSRKIVWVSTVTTEIAIARDQSCH